MHTMLRLAQALTGLHGYWWSAQTCARGYQQYSPTHQGRLVHGEDLL